MHQSEILEPLHRLARELIDVDARSKSHLLEYTDDDVMAAVLVFGHILINRKAHALERDGISEEEGAKVMERYGEKIHDLTLGMTGVNIQTYYDSTTEESNPHEDQ